MDKRASIFLSIGVIWVSLVFAIFFFSLMRPGIATRWKPEQAPPESVSTLKLGASGEILAQTPQGNVYEFKYGADPIWERVIVPSGTPAIGSNCSQGNDNHLVLPPPGKVKSRVGENCVYIESAYHLEVALLEDGRIVSWLYEGYAYTDLFVLCFLSVACVLGMPFLLFGLGMKIYRTFKKAPL